MGSNHARAYVVNPKIELVAAADTDPENLELFQRRFGVNVYSDYHEMLAEGSVSTSPARCCPSASTLRP